MRIIATLGILTLAAVVLSGCGQGTGLMSQDKYGVYVDGDSYFVVNHKRGLIRFRTDSQPSPVVLLEDTEKGEGLTFSTWRDGESCGLRDDSGNVFAVPRQEKFTKDGLTYSVVLELPAYSQVNEGPKGDRIIAVQMGAETVMEYLYDDAVGIRWIDRYHNGGKDRRIVLERGVGLLAHCRGTAFSDFK